MKKFIIRDSYGKIKEKTVYLNQLSRGLYHGAEVFDFNGRPLGIISSKALASLSFPIFKLYMDEIKNSGIGIAEIERCYNSAKNLFDEYSDNNLEKLKIDSQICAQYYCVSNLYILKDKRAYELSNAVRYLGTDFLSHMISFLPTEEGNRRLYSEEEGNIFLEFLRSGKHLFWIGMKNKNYY